jgi:hypothetical protein
MIPYDWKKDDRWRGVDGRFLWLDENTGLTLSVWDKGLVTLESDERMSRGYADLDDSARRRLINALGAVPEVQKFIREERMTKYKVTLIIESDEDPSGILDEFEEMVRCSEHLLNQEAVDEGEAVSVEEID